MSDTPLPRHRFVANVQYGTDNCVVCGQKINRRRLPWVRYCSSACRRSKADSEAKIARRLLAAVREAMGPEDHNHE